MLPAMLTIQKKLTDLYIKNAKPATKPYKLRPREVGLFILVRPNGKKWWRFAYSFRGKENTLSLGTYPSTSLSDARKARDAARGLLAAGTDPSRRRQKEKDQAEQVAEDTFRAVAEEWLKLKSEAMAPVTHNKARWMLDFAMPKLGSMSLPSIQPPDVLVVLREVEATGKSETVHRLKARISEVFRFGIATGRTTTDPTRDLRGAIKPKRATQHFAALTDPRDVGHLMRAIDGYSGSLEVCAALKLAPLLFVRPGELRAAQRPQFDLDGDKPTWRYYISKTKTHHIVPLSAQAVSILRELFALTGHRLRLQPNAPQYVFPGARSRLVPMSENAVTAALRYLGYTGEQMTGHGFRAMARTMLAELGWMPDIIERQLAHKPSGPLGAAYDRAAYLSERRKLMQAWADYLDVLRDDRKVVPGKFGRAA